MVLPIPLRSFFFFNDTATTEIYTLSLHDALPISHVLDPVERVEDAEEVDAALGGARHEEAHDVVGIVRIADRIGRAQQHLQRSEEHTSELQSPCNLVCRLLLEKREDLRSSVQYGD